MRKILYVIPVLCLFFTSCREESFVAGNTEEGLLDITFTVNLPGAYDLLQTRAWKEKDVNEDSDLLIQNMYVLVFDEAGFISRHPASKAGGFGQFKVQLPASTDSRILHFICNYDKWGDFPDEEMRHLNEAMVLAGMYVEYPKVAYWNRTKVDRISSALSLHPTLIRNVAKISVINRSGEDIDNSYLDEVSFAIGNYYNRGTVTGFNKLTGAFDEEGVHEATGADLCLIDEEDDFVPAFESSLSGDKGVALLAYERFNSNPNTDNHLYVIIKGAYYLDGQKQPGERYYKVDIVEPDSEVLYDIRRNRHYILTINQVLSEGYRSLEEAVNSLALNNIATSVMQSYNSISNGDYILNLEYVNKLFVKPANPDTDVSDFAIRYSYVDAITGATDNTGVEMSWESTNIPAVATVHPLPNLKTTGAIGLDEGYVDRVSGKLVGSLPPNGIAESSIRIHKSNLSRTIILRLRQPFTFENIQMNPTVAARNSGIPVTLSFDIPVTLEDQLPFPVYISAPMLTPDPNSKVYFEDMGAVFRYRYTVQSTGTQSLGFKTASTHGEGTVTIESELFDPESVVFSRQ